MLPFQKRLHSFVVKRCKSRVGWYGGVEWGWGDRSSPINIPWRVWIHHAYKGGERYGPPKCRSGVLYVRCALMKRCKLVRVGWRLGREVNFDMIQFDHYFDEF